MNFQQLRNDRQRAILNTLASSKDEMSGQQLYRALEHSPNGMGLATVYRNLRQLQQCGLIRCRHLPSGESLYAPIDRDKHYYTCVDCGQTRQLDHCPINELHVPKEISKGFNLLFHTLEFFGICSTCLDKQTSQ